VCSSDLRVKAAHVKRWSRRLDQEAYGYQAVAGGLSAALAADIPRALAHLDNMLIALEAYAVSPAPGAESSVASGDGGSAASVAESSSMARAAPLQEFERLRRQTPAAAERTQLPCGALDAAWRHAATENANWRTELAGLAVAHVPVSGEDKIVIARGAAQAGPRLYLERIDRASPGDSGWYVGSVDSAAAEAYEAVRTAEFVAARPDLAPLLELPAGCLAVVHGTELEVVVDAQDHVLWPSPRSGS
jgi:hypothetical protein